MNNVIICIIVRTKSYCSIHSQFCITIDWDTDITIFVCSYIILPFVYYYLILYC